LRHVVFIRAARIGQAWSDCARAFELIIKAERNDPYSARAKRNASSVSESRRRRKKFMNNKFNRHQQKMSEIGKVETGTVWLEKSHSSGDLTTDKNVSERQIRVIAPDDKGKIICSVTYTKLEYLTEEELRQNFYQLVDRAELR
jgi:hypothetical protein